MPILFLTAVRNHPARNLRSPIENSGNRNATARSLGYLFRRPRFHHLPDSGDSNYGSENVEAIAFQYGQRRAIELEKRI